MGGTDGPPSYVSDRTRATMMGKGTHAPCRPTSDRPECFTRWIHSQSMEPTGRQRKSVQTLQDSVSMIDSHRRVRTVLLWALAALVVPATWEGTTGVHAWVSPRRYPRQSIPRPRHTGRRSPNGMPRHCRTLAAQADDKLMIKDYEFALLFDCDGVILETEELHRRAYNTAFREFNLTIHGVPVEWDVEYYDILQNTVGGGKPKMFWHFRNTAKAFPQHGPWPQQPAPATTEQQQALIDALQDCKTQHFQKLLLQDAEARPGVLELMDQALNDPHIAVGVCSASTKAAAETTLSVTLGQERLKRLDVCILGDDVEEKKPHPMIYNTARERLGQLPAERCVVIEDSLVGLKAAVAANMKCIVTYTSSTASVDFYAEGASAKLPNLEGVTLDSIFGPLRFEGVDAELLVGQKELP